MILNTSHINTFNTIKFFDENDQSVSKEYKGRKYQVVTQTTLFSQKERLYRGMLAISAIVASLGLILIFRSTQMWQLLTLREKSSIEIERTLIDLSNSTISPSNPIPAIDPTSPVIDPSNPAPVIDLISPIANPLKPIKNTKQETTPVKEEEEIDKEETNTKLAFPALPIPPEGMIKNGYGEYLVYRIGHEGKKIAISEQEYEKIFDVIEKTRIELPNDRHAYLEEKIQEKLGKEVRLAFIPRTLYEQIFLHECIQEEMDKGESLNAKELGAAAVFQRTVEEEEKLSVEEKEKLKKKYGDMFGQKMTSKNRKKHIQQSMTQAFWQLCIYNDKDYKKGFKKRNEDDYRQEHLVKVAAKLNKVALEKFNGKESGFTFAEIVDVQKQEMNFFRSLKDSESENYVKAGVGFYTVVSLAQRFRDERHPIRNHEMHPLGIEKETDRSAQIIQKATQLECTVEAINHLLLYRGANFKEDEVMRKEPYGKNVFVNSLSYGTSLYGGALYDGGATAFHYMRQRSTDAQAFMIPLEKQLNGQTPFHTYFAHPLISLGSYGEVFHARTKLWKLPEEEEEVWGFFGGGTHKFSKVKECCKTSQTKEEVEGSFAEYKSKAYILAAAFS